MCIVYTKKKLLSPLKDKYIRTNRNVSVYTEDLGIRMTIRIKTLKVSVKEMRMFCETITGTSWSIVVHNNEDAVTRGRSCDVGSCTGVHEGCKS